MRTTHPADNRPWNTRPHYSHPARWIPGEFFAWGGDGNTGYSTEADSLAVATADGVDLNEIWAQAQTALSMLNKERSALAALISYPTTRVGDAVPQQVASAHFEVASEFGEPHGIRSAPDALILGYDYEDYDLASRMTWKFLRSATAEQVRDTINRAFEADNRLVTGTLLRRLFDPTMGANEFQHPVYPLWNGVNGSPPPHAGQAFPTQTSHLLPSGNSVIDPQDLLLATSQVTTKGYGIGPTSRLLILCHPAEAEEISTFRAGVETNGFESKHDFIPSAGAPAYLSVDNIVGKVAPESFGGLEVSGSWGPAWVVPSYLVPQGYFAVVATGGPSSSMNPVAFREHVQPAYRGLLQIPGAQPGWPLRDSYFVRGFGTGVRHRGAAAVMQITTNPTYTPPTWSWH